MPCKPRRTHSPPTPSRRRARWPSSSPTRSRSPAAPSGKTAGAGSLVSLFAEAPVTETTKPARQVTHWLFALGDTLAINAARCLALLATHDDARAWAAQDAGASLDACLHETMRLWPTTPML